MSGGHGAAHRAGVGAGRGTERGGKTALRDTRAARPGLGGRGGQVREAARGRLGLWGVRVEL